MFPYLAPIKDWAVEVFKDREQNKIDANLKMPWMILTSGAKVLKEKVPENAADASKAYENLIKNTDSSFLQYSGCIIKNNTTPELNYQLNETILGFDFDGKPIKIEGETNRRISTPIIESVDIDTDGANNTLKTAKINVRCFSLKQYEMFELFFCKPGMNVLFEWGNNILSRKQYTPSKDAERGPAATDISTLLVPKNKYDTFKQTFSNYYRVNNETFRNYMINVEASRGTYDLVAGKVTDYNFSIDADGTYAVMIEISQGNQMTLAIPVNTAEPTVNAKGKGTVVKNGINEWALELCANLGINYDSFKGIVSKADEKEFFNWGKLNVDKKDESSSKESYISLRFILKVLMNYMLFKDGSFDRETWEFTLPTYMKGGKDEECIPFRIHKNLISSSKDIIFPNANLPKFTGDKDGVTIIVDPKNFEDGLINGYSVVEPVPLSLKRGSGVININPSTNPDIKNGNALNIFLNYKTVAQIWKKSYTRIDFLKGILDTLNSNSYGLYRFQYMPQITGGKATIVDIKSTGDSDSGTKPYRFKVGSIDSIAREFSFNFEMSNLVAGRTVFNAQKFLIESLKAIKPGDSKKIDLPADAYRSYDNSLFGNADGFYSINVIDLEALKKTFQDAQDKKRQPPADDTKKNEAPNIGDVIDGKITKFKAPGKDKIQKLIFNDIDFITKLITSVDNEKSTLTPIDISLTIDGLSGLSCGEYFLIDGVPEMYNKIGVFQITNTSHNISTDGWVTKIEAGFRINKK